MEFNFRFSPACTVAALQDRVTDLLERHCCRYELDWTVSALPFVTPAGALVLALAEAMVGVALGQLERPGSPAVFGNFLTTTSLRSCLPVRWRYSCWMSIPQ